jgi:hypothetical protein
MSSTITICENISITAGNKENSVMYLKKAFPNKFSVTNHTQTSVKEINKVTQFLKRKKTHMVMMKSVAKY